MVDEYFQILKWAIIVIFNVIKMNELIIIYYYDWIIKIKKK